MDIWDRVKNDLLRRDVVLVLCSVFLLAFSLISLSGNYGLISSYYFESGQNIGDALFFAGNLLISLFFVSAFDFIVRVIVVFLFALNISLFVATYKKSNFLAHGKSSLLGFLAIIFGTQCVSCGPVLLGGVATFLGFGSVFALLPLHGKEFSLVAIIFLLYSNYFLLDKLANLRLCKPAFSDVQ